MALKKSPSLHVVSAGVPKYTCRDAIARSFCTTRSLLSKDWDSGATGLNQNNVDDQERSTRGKELIHDGQLDEKIGEAKELQARTPWHREGSDTPPVKRLRSAGAMTKGSILWMVLYSIN